ncbi:hypothetical protein AA12717_0148 [Gluconacetobacter sacchari DSM 12717]|uniref:Transposase InsH N-terminal domain-containing protein n=1 Tax=Gluconacetobacter sacchari DSM 12717 TaxID=1307940 RepID=A0ABQ0P1X4_9PROT|nr:hypothetical protein AA12717_0148 [Gluconacetobacter sacchari DSM 12717]
MLALLIYAYTNGVFSSHRIERATYRAIGMRFVATNLHPDHDTIATFRRGNGTAIEAAFVHVLLLAPQDHATDARMNAVASVIHHRSRAQPDSLPEREAIMPPAPLQTQSKSHPFPLLSLAASRYWMRPQRAVER